MNGEQKRLKISYKTKGVCSRFINIEVEDGKIQDIEFIGGCDGNLQGICALVKGKKTQDVIDTLEGIRCGSKSTSCPDQLAKALKQTVG